MNAIDQQWHNAQILSKAEIAIDDVWSRYVSLGGTADPVALTAYLHGKLLLSILQQNLVTHAVNDAVTDSHDCPTHALCPVAGGTVHQHTPAAEPHQAVAGTGASWPALRIRLSGMFDPDKAEQKRLAALQRTGLIRAGKEERFDRFTREARERFGVDSAAITLITDTQQIVKSAAGPLGGNVPATYPSAPTPSPRTGRWSSPTPSRTTGSGRTLSSSVPHTSASTPATP